MKIILGIITIIIASITCYIAYNNRGHDKIIELLVSSVILGTGVALIFMAFMPTRNRKEKIIFVVSDRSIR